MANWQVLPPSSTKTEVLDSQSWLWNSSC